MSIINEEWRSIDGFIDYQVSNIGRVRNSKTGRILKPRYRGKKMNYQSVALYNGGGQVNFSIHRLVANEFIPNPENKQQVDHIDGNKENNVYTNLRWATNSENQINNIHKRSNHTSIYKGVSWNKGTNKWIVKITLNTKQMHLGLYTDEVEAAKVYGKKAKELFGEYANINFPEET